MKRNITSGILKAIEAAPEGRVFTAKEQLHLGSRAAVDQALARLAKRGFVLRVGRGRYVRPVQTRFGMRAPAPEDVIQSFATSAGETVVPTGASAAHGLGLTTQVPVRTVYLTSGRSRRLWLGRQSIELKHAPHWQLQLPGTAAGQAVRALAWLGPGQARAGAEAVRRTLTVAEQRAVLATRASLPTWLAETVSEAFASAAHEGEPAAHG